MFPTFHRNFEVAECRRRTCSFFRGHKNIWVRFFQCELGWKAIVQCMFGSFRLICVVSFPSPNYSTSSDQHPQPRSTKNIWHNKTTKCFCSRFMDSVVKSVFRFLGLAKLEYERGHEIFALRIFSHSSSYCVVAWLFCRWITRVQDKMSKFDSCIFNGNIIAKPQTILSYKCCCGLKRISVWLVQNVSTHHSVVQCAKFW